MHHAKLNSKTPSDMRAFSFTLMAANRNFEACAGGCEISKKYEIFAFYCILSYKFLLIDRRENKASWRR
jgi:hypothetical protein